jgi:glycosyltransferase involved in cell wall biosynthesis
MKSSYFSAVVLAKNDARTINDCIHALQQITDDIVIVLDNRSSDNTKSIAQSSGARVFEKSWEGYSANKNFGIDQTLNNWILCPDSDEIIDTDLIKNINDLQPQSGVAYEMNIMTYFGDYAVQHCGWYPDWNIRLFDKRIMRWNNNGVHESLESQSPYARKRINGLIHHYSFIDESHMQDKYDYYARLRAKEWVSTEKKPPLIKRILGPEFRFFRTFILKRGFLDGHYGLLIAKNEYILKKKELTYWKELVKTKE